MDRNALAVWPGLLARPSLSVRRAWIEILKIGLMLALSLVSLSVRRAWIEIDDMSGATGRIFVALRKESVDRNRF